MIEYCKAQTRAKVEYPFPVVKRLFGYVKLRFPGLIKNTAPLTTLLPCRTCGWLQND
ncbi:Transposase family protein [Pseudomonas syringae pv. cilantro]|uniref:Transposase family protein n=1 Tax=Pseudomonas syringae pv. cilantro TaxID=81035 RepID=A0A0N1JNJ0_PSESX|nr:Transposase family protein [Pseudomonas syringae pv. cilantro]